MTRKLRSKAFMLIFRSSKQEAASLTNGDTGLAAGIYTASFNALRGRTLITLRAGFALKVIGSLVNGLIPSC